MSIEGTWWLLIEEAPFNEERTPQLTLTDGAVLDGRSDEHLGHYSERGGQVTIEMQGSSISARIDAEEPVSMSGNLFEGQGDGQMCMPVSLYPLSWRPPSAEEIEQMLRDLYPDRVGNTGPRTVIFDGS